MLDQAATLRQLANETNKEMEPQIISFVSGQIDEGASSFIIKLGSSLAMKNKRVLIIIDSVDKNLVRSSSYRDILNCDSSGKSLKEYIIDGPFGVKILQGSTDTTKLNSMDDKKKQSILQRFRDIGIFNYIIIYAGGGINISTLSYISLSNWVYILTDSQNSSITQTYSLIKAVNYFKLKDKVKLLVIRGSNLQEGRDTYKNIKTVSNRFLDITIEYAGFVMDKTPLEKEPVNIQELINNTTEATLDEDINRIAGEILIS